MRQPYRSLAPHQERQIQDKPGTVLNANFTDAQRLQLLAQISFFLNQPGKNVISPCTKKYEPVEKIDCK